MCTVAALRDRHRRDCLLILATPFRGHGKGSRPLQAYQVASDVHRVSAACRGHGSRETGRRAKISTSVRHLVGHLRQRGKHHPVRRACWHGSRPEIVRRKQGPNLGGSVVQGEAELRGHSITLRGVLTDSPGSFRRVGADSPSSRCCWPQDHHRDRCRHPRRFHLPARGDQRRPGARGCGSRCAARQHRAQQGRVRTSDRERIR